MTYNCPICQKPGLEDFTLKPIVCPQCNSDLKGFLLINSTNKETKSKIRKLVLFFTSSIIVFLGVFLTIYFSVHNNSQSTDVKDLNATDSIYYYKNYISKLQKDINSRIDKMSHFNYIVKPGDNLSSIAQFFYNDWRLYKIIEKDNHLSEGQLLIPKDTLKISLKQE